MKFDLAPLRKWGGLNEWDDVHPPTNIRIKVDANSGEDVKFVIHELLHVVMFPMVVGRLDDTLEEVIMVALDEYVWEYVRKNPAREREWRAAIRKKFHEGKEDVPHEERVDRKEGA